MDNIEYRRRLIERVEALRIEARITRLAFHQQIGPVAAGHWTEFATSNKEEAWKFFSLQAVNRIAELLRVGVEVFHFPDDRCSG